MWAFVCRKNLVWIPESVNYYFDVVDRRTNREKVKGSIDCNEMISYQRSSFELIVCCGKYSKEGVR